MSVGLDFAVTHAHTSTSPGELTASELAKLAKHTTKVTFLKAYAYQVESVFQYLPSYQYRSIEKASRERCLLGTARPIERIRNALDGVLH